MTVVLWTLLALFIQSVLILQAYTDGYEAARHHDGKRWYTTKDLLLAGMCGPIAPIILVLLEKRARDAADAKKTKEVNEMLVELDKILNKRP